MKKLAFAGLVLLSLVFGVVLNVWRIWHFADEGNHRFTRFVIALLAGGVVFFAVFKRRDR